MKRVCLILLAALMIVSSTTATASAHCQIPCGIYDDPARIDEMQEHVATIEKSMQTIQKLSKLPQKDAEDWNQLFRWVMNKEDHADKLTEIVTYYFMAQRIKPVDPADQIASRKYIRELTMLHQMMIQAMKAKQTANIEHCDALKGLITKFKKSYLGDHHTGHSHHH